MSEYKLTFFNSRGLVEPIRYMFAFAEVPYEDIRLPINKCKYFPVMPPEQKSLYPWGNVPMLEVDGKVLGRTFTIARFLARKFNLVGKDEFESAKCDEYADAVKDFGLQWKDVQCGQEPMIIAEKRENTIKNVVPTFMRNFEQILQNNGGMWLVGSGVTWADFFLGNTITFFSVMQDVDMTEGFPLLKRLSENILLLPGVKEYVKKRPKVEYFKPNFEWKD